MTRSTTLTFCILYNGLPKDHKFPFLSTLESTKPFCLEFSHSLLLSLSFFSSIPPFPSFPFFPSLFCVSVPGIQTKDEGFVQWNPFVCRKVYLFMSINVIERGVRQVLSLL